MARMEMNEIYKKRAAALQLLVDEKFGGNAADFARHYDLDETRIRQLLTGFKNFGEKSARQMEKDCKLPDFYFDVADSQEAAALVLHLTQLKKGQVPDVLRYIQFLKGDAR